MGDEEKQGAAATPGAGDTQTGTTPGAGDGQGGAGDDGKDLADLSPAELARMIGELNKENAATRKKLREKEAAEQKAAEAARTAEEERLKKQGEFETLAEQRAAKIKELETRAAKVDALEGRIKAANDARIAKVPEAMRTLIPKYDPVELSEWLDANLDKLVKLPAPDLDDGRQGERGKQQPTTQPPIIRL